MNILVIGDVVGKLGVDMVKKQLPSLKQQYNIDFTIVNAENSADGMGITKNIYTDLRRVGADVITMGNHTWGKKEIFSFIDEEERLIRPSNYTEGLPGKGKVLVDCKNHKIGVIDLIGRVNVGEVKEENSVCPFIKSEELIEKIKKENVDYIFVDFHAEATAEKIALGYFLEDKVTCVYGTHTHVQTADEQIINNMAYITDVGMTGPKGSVLGLKKEIAVARFYTGQRIKYECSENEAMFNAVIVETDDETKAAIKIDRINE